MDLHCFHKQECLKPQADFYESWDYRGKAAQQAQLSTRTVRGDQCLSIAHAQSKAHQDTLRLLRLQDLGNTISAATEQHPR